MERTDSTTTSITGICFENYFVIQDKETCLLIGLHVTSGAYPIMARQPSEVKFWPTRKEAEKYRSTWAMEDNWTIAACQFQLKTVAS